MIARTEPKRQTTGFDLIEVTTSLRTTSDFLSAGCFRKKLNSRSTLDGNEGEGKFSAGYSLRVGLRKDQIF